MARKFIALYGIYQDDGKFVRSGTVFEEGDPFLEGRESLFRVEGKPDLKPAPKLEEATKVELYVQPEQPQPKRRGRPPGSKNRPRG